jgi:hypothetical protein
MPTSLQYPLERSRALQQRWARLLQRTAVGPSANGPHGFAIVANTIPPRDPDDDDNDDDEEEDGREPAVIREPDKDE